jgi:hypothetical protein
MQQHKLITDHRRPSLLDKLRGHYLEGRKLSEKQEHKRIQYEQAHALRIQGFSREQTVKMLLSRRISKSASDAYRVVSNAEQLFGDINAVHKEGLRHILTENLMRVYNSAMASGSWKEANKSNEIIAKINNLMDHDQVPIDWKKIIIPIPVYTSDPAVLKRQETIDIPHEDVDDDE